VRRAIQLFVVVACTAFLACLPSYAFTDEASDASAPDAHGADGGDGAPPGADARSAEDATAPDAGADANGSETGTVDASQPGPGITLDPGFPKTAQINDAEGTALPVTFDVPAGGRLLVAVVVWGAHGGSGVWPVTFDSPNAQWTSQVQSVSTGSYTNAVGVGIWTAWANGALASETGTARSATNTMAVDALLAVYSLAGASQSAGVGDTNTSNGFTNDAPLSFTIDAHAAGSFVVGGILDGVSGTGLEGNTIAGTVYDKTLASSSDDSLAIGRLATLTTGAGNVSVGQDESMSADVAAGIEILPSP
jgi:hypothetical protein